MIRINLLPVRVSKKKIAGKNQLIFFGLALILALLAAAPAFAAEGERLPAQACPEAARERGEVDGDERRESQSNQ